MSEHVEIEKELEKGNIIQVKPRGYSMYPLFVPGRDEALIQKTGSDGLRRGDVVLYRRTGSILVLHRIWKRQGDSFYMVGDNQREVEGPLPASQIRGRMIGIIRKGKHISVEHPVYRLYSGVWLLLRPFRPGISRGIHRIKTWMGKNRMGE